MRVEFQVLINLYVHQLLWITDAPVSSNDNINEYIQLIDGIFKAFVPVVNKIQKFSI